jgi:hypothetical protein
MILEEAQSNSIQATLSKFALCLATFYYWRGKLTVHGADDLMHQATRNQEPVVRKLEKEINHKEYPLRRKN